MRANPVYNFLIKHPDVCLKFNAAVEYQCIYITMFDYKTYTNLRRIVTDEEFDLFLGQLLEMMYEQLNNSKVKKEDNTNASN